MQGDKRGSYSHCREGGEEDLKENASLNNKVKELSSSEAGTLKCREGKSGFLKTPLRSIVRGWLLAAQWIRGREGPRGEGGAFQSM